ncbi:MAG: hypothetical protein CMP28_15305 [Roseibacillus sp.]|nr:hypothetical protein [Roseibacillus sp.]
MNPSNPPRILIATAGFGDGHNPAARGLAAALEGRSDVLVVDPCAEGSPWFNNLLRKGYQFAITYLPRIWELIYNGVERRDFSKQNIPFMHPVERAFSARLDEFDPDVIISTYPLYPYFVERYFKSGRRPRPIVTVVTDSIEINAAWRKAPTDFWLVTDEETKSRLIQQAIPEEKIVETGFPVNPVFDRLQPLGENAQVQPFRVLYFPTANKKSLQRTARLLLRHPDGPIELTIVLGRNLRRLYRLARGIAEDYPGRVRIRGWSRKVPQLLCEHHLAIGKAGGATVHESLAACCPMLIHHLVPGQEEGNLELLRTIGGGDLADTEVSLGSALQSLLANHASGWRRQKQNLACRARPQASRVAASFVLELATGNASPPTIDTPAG